MSNSDFITLIITNYKNENNEVKRRFNKDINIEEFKNKLELIVGIEADAMKLEVYNENELVCEPNNDDFTLKSYKIDDGMRVHVTDIREDESKDLAVQKFELSNEVYSQMPDTVQSFLKQHKLGKYDEDRAKKMEENRLLELENEKKLISTMNVNDRCEVNVPGFPKRKATIMYIGQTEFKKGYWIGVKYDEPLGKNNGSVAGVKYFECHDKYGGFIKPMHIVIGDFPEDDELNEL